jgi:hypothetical protein
MDGGSSVLMIPLNRTRHPINWSCVAMSHVGAVLVKQAHLVGTQVSAADVSSIILRGRIHTKLGICPYYESFEQEWSSFFLIWAATS